MISNMCRQLKNYGVDIENASLRLDIIDNMPPRERGELKWLLVSSPGTTTESVLKKMTDFALKAEVTQCCARHFLSTPTPESESQQH
uniref:Uncharacterized protein n=1 Tax=Panagrolaimus superbus TaxID=310955 RepID=A0A914Z759_9BILA